MENTQILNIDESSANNWMTVAIEAVIPAEENSLNTLGEETIESESRFDLQTFQKEICEFPSNNSSEFVLSNVEREQYQHSAGNQDEESLRKLLKEFVLEPVFEYLRAAQVTYRSLNFMRKEDLKEAIPPLGLRMEFRERLFFCKKEQFGIDDGTMSICQSVENY